MRFRGRLFEKPKIDDLGEERITFGLAHHHVHHFVIAGVTERFLKSAISKRRAKDDRMQLAFVKNSGERDAFSFDSSGKIFQPFEQASMVGTTCCPTSNKIFRSRSTRSCDGVDLHFHLIQPQAQIHQERLHVGNDDFEFRPHLIHLLPLPQKIAEAVRSIRAVERRKMARSNPASSKVASQIIVVPVLTML